MANPICVDISHWQADPAWSVLKANGTQAVILKCTEGTTYLDPTYVKRQLNCKQNGLCMAPYHFLKHGNIETQMKLFILKANMNTGDRMIIDYEDKACVLQDLLDAVKYLKAHTACEITVYGGSLLKEQLGDKRNDYLAENTSLWLAQYTTGTPTWPKATWPYWSLWQYSEKEEVRGFNVLVDASKWNGKPESLPGWFHKGTPTIADATVSITTTEGVTVTVNGKTV
jgi:lysozyme